MFSIHGMRIHNCHAAGDMRSRNQRIVPEIEEVQQKVVAQTMRVQDSSLLSSKEVARFWHLIVSRDSVD